MRTVVVVLLGFLSVLVGCTKKSNDRPNTLNVVSIAKIKGMDPNQAEDRYASLEILRVYEGLLQYHPLKRPYELEPLLAEKLPEISKDGLKYTFTIRKGVLFQDDAAFPNGKGRELKAKDFVYSWKRIGDPRTQSASWWLFEGRVVGMDEWRDKITKNKDTADKIFEEEIAGLKATGDYQLQVELKKPFPQFLNTLAMPNTVVVAREVVEKYGKEFMNHAVGTGAFMIEKYQPNDLLEYKRNPTFREMLYPSEGAPGDKEAGLLADAGKKLPFIDGIKVRIIVEDQPRWLHFLNGEFDLGGIPKDNFSQAIKGKDAAKPVSVNNLDLSDELKSKGIDLSTEISLDLTYTAYNNESVDFPQFKDKRVRQAISLALDNADEIKLFYNSMAIPAQTPIPPGLPGYDANYKNPYRTGDIEKARALLAEAGFPGGKGFPEIPYDTLADATSRQMADYAAKQLDRIGLRLKVVSGTWPQLLQRINNRQAQLWGIAWGADYPDAENFLQLFYGPNAQNGGTNASFYKNKAFDQLFEKARILPDSPERTAMYRQLAQMIAEDCPVIFGVHRFSVGLKQAWIKNFKYDEFAYNRSKYIRIDEEIKKKYRK